MGRSLQYYIVWGTILGMWYHHRKKSWVLCIGIRSNFGYNVPTCDAVLPIGTSMTRMLHTCVGSSPKHHVITWETVLDIICLHGKKSWISCAHMGNSLRYMVSIWDKAQGSIHLYGKKSGMSEPASERRLMCGVTTWEEAQGILILIQKNS